MHNNQRGLSLVEILAGIVLLGIITTFTTIIITNSFDSNDTSAKEISLKQDTNLMISQLRKEFYDGDDADKPEDNIICLDNQQGRVRFDLENSEANGKKLESENGKVCIKGFDRHDPLRLKVLTENDDGKQVNIETTLKKGGNRKVSYGSGDMDPCELPKVDWSQVKTKKVLPCFADNDLIWTGESLDSCDKHIIDGNLQISGDVNDSSKKLNLIVNQSLYAKGQALFESKTADNVGANLLIKGNVLFNDEFALRRNDHMVVEKGACFLDRFQMYKKSSLHVKRNISLHVEPDVGDSVMIVEGNLVSKTHPFKLLKDGSLKVYGNASFQGLDFDHHKEFCVKGLIIGTKHKSNSSCPKPPFS